MYRAPPPKKNWHGNLISFHKQIEAPWNEIQDSFIQCYTTNLFNLQCLGNISDTTGHVTQSDKCIEMSLFAEECFVVFFHPHGIELN